MKILVVWEMIPDSIDLFLVDLDKKYLTCHNKMINQVNNTDEDEKLLNELQQILGEQTPILRNTTECVEHDLGKIHILHSGFLL